MIKYVFVYMMNHVGLECMHNLRDTQHNAHECRKDTRATVLTEYPSPPDGIETGAGVGGGGVGFTGGASSQHSVKAA
jgi:hypothetical protein